MWKSVVVATAIVAPAALSSARQAPPPASSTASTDAVFSCRKLEDSAARLACYDKAVAAMQDAVASRDLVVVDKEEVHKARRSLFGFNVPTLKLFGEGRSKGHVEEEESQITATIKSARLDGYGNWILVLDDGAVWHQTDGTIGRPPKLGETVVIRRGTLGSYFLRVGSQPGVKAKREG